jgi:hypothetical protein
MLRADAVALIEEWEDKAENGNYHELSAVLYAFAEKIKGRTGSETLLVIKSYDEFPPTNNIEELVIDE